jgi:two-component system nitrogen regulation response regulator GlnG
MSSAVSNTVAGVAPVSLGEALAGSTGVLGDAGVSGANGAFQGAHDAAAPASLTEVLGVSATPAWLRDLERDARQRLEVGQPDVWDVLTRQFEACLIHSALELTRGRRIEAAQKLGIGRNTITRKIQELGMDE